MKAGMKHAASFVTAGRMAGALLLLLTTPLSAAFYVIYFFCCVSDILDGFIARKMKTESRVGKILDSAADFLLTAVLLYLFIPLLTLEPWMFFWIGAVALIRFASLGTGLVKYRAFGETARQKHARIIFSLLTLPLGKRVNYP